MMIMINVIIDERVSAEVLVLELACRYVLVYICAAEQRLFLGPTRLSSATYCTSSLANV